MCEQPKRHIRSALTPLRVVLAALGMAVIAAAVIILISGMAFLPEEARDVVLSLAVGAGIVLLVAGVFMPMVREVELGPIPTLKIAPALRDRENELRSVFERQRGDMEYCAHLLCDDPKTARQLLEASWSLASSDWKGPVTPQLRVYTLCVFVEMLRKHEKWVKAGPPDGPPKPPWVKESALSKLPYEERITIVLHEFANLTVGEIAGLTGRPAESVGRSLAHAEATTGGLALEEGRP
ncbi:hypothetical protein J3A64_004301 [Pseudarthrobacter sp. PvP004]|uniref:RNA polymerase sigma factor 70 region 4 type 2 domain-containing protein n=1 Tax=Paenarthrobacter aurescens (strain TC1) TaxID=290340 RepID=A1RAP6_PAEAT|nr:MULTISPECIES: sigma-70 family RNA polymerase sigma factor [Micrococcaceae]ABM08065.1 hypothetical protein AAur_3619 [Paenarthrobacter aurescens TC1]MBP2268837.1 hypothetical protein [Pseudarthrobacter sp. PvP004]